MKKGFAFVTYVNVFEAEAALKKLRGRMIDGRAIAVEMAGKKEDNHGAHAPSGYDPHGRSSRYDSGNSGAYPAARYSHGGHSNTLYVNSLATTVTDAQLRYVSLLSSRTRLAAFVSESSEHSQLMWPFPFQHLVC